MKEVIHFLAALERNNNREWFHAHKADYLAAQQQFNAFAEQLITRLALFDESVAGLEPKDCTYRIYRDTRFSADKRPYKTHIGAFVCPGGKKSGFSGYYFQVGPGEEGYPDGCLLATGNYRFDAKVMQILREDISLDPDAFTATLDRAPLFRLDDAEMLKRTPRGFDSTAPYAPYLRHKAFCLCYSPGTAFMQAEALLDRTAEAFRSTYPFLRFLNRAIAYANE